MIFIAGIVISIFLSALLLFKKNRSPGDNYLLCWFILITIHQFYYYFDHSDLFTEYTSIIGFDLPIPLMHGPFLFLYASALVGKLPERKINRLLHFLPALICYLYLVDFYLLTGEQKLYIIDHEGVGYEAFLTIRFAAIIISGITYVLLTILLLRKHQRKIKENFSDIEKINLKWLQYLNFGIGIIWLTVIFGTEELTFVAVVIYVLFIGVYGIRQTPIFTNNGMPAEGSDLYPENLSPGLADTVPPSIESELQEKEARILTDTTKPLPVREKYKKSGLNNQDLETINMQLTGLMETEKLYTDPEITLGDIAQKLHIHPNYLSQVINTVFNKNFYDYINEQRVEEFLRIVKDPKNQHFTLLSLAFGCGFNSKSSFNRNFRKVTGQSPSHYLREIEVHLEEVG